MARFAVIGSGISGLSAAYDLTRAGHDVTIFEASTRGGKLRSSAVPGVDFLLDEGADAFLARVPDALDLCAELGIDDLVHPAERSAFVDAGKGLRPLPSGQVLGVPTDLDELAASGLVSPAGIARAATDLERPAPPLTEDISVGAFVRDRLGDEVCDHLVEPLLGGINGGMADGLSLRAAAPQLWAFAARGGSLIESARAAKAAADPSRPVFATPAAGMAELPRVLLERLGPDVTFAGTASGLRFGDSTVDVREIGSDLHTFAGAVLAIPASDAAILLDADGHGSELHADLASISFASVVLITLVADRAAVAHPLDGSGFVVARTAGRSITACSFGSSKWAHWDDGLHTVFRVSMGHDGMTDDLLDRSDDDLLAIARHDLETILDCDVRPSGRRLVRWERSFPQYRPGHVDRVASIRAGMRARGPVEIAGMSYDGIGVPASIKSGRSAAGHLLETH